MSQAIFEVLEGKQESISLFSSLVLSLYPPLRRRGSVISVLRLAGVCCSESVVWESDSALQSSIPVLLLLQLQTHRAQQDTHYTLRGSVRVQRVCSGGSPLLLDLRLGRRWRNRRRGGGRLEEQPSAEGVKMAEGGRREEGTANPSTPAITTITILCIQLYTNTDWS